MSDDGKAKVNVNAEELAKVVKQYKKIKKRMKSNLFEIQRISGNPTLVSKLLEENLGDEIGDI
jgi:hypothetical protein|tara:strand:+ start:652 stop:840 length:189 start_codon:yes stop_codon:yes gene_type:complete